MSYERKCILCGITYKYCPHCGEFDTLPKWMTMFDKEACKEIFNAVSEYNFGKLTTAQAKMVLDKYPLEDHTKYTKITQKSIADIDMKVNKSKKRTVKNVSSEKNIIDKEKEVIKE